MMISELGLELFFTANKGTPSGWDVLIVKEDEKSYSLFTKANPVTNVDITSRAVFDALIYGIEKAGFQEKSIECI